MSRILEVLPVAWNSLNAFLTTVETSTPRANGSRMTNVREDGTIRGTRRPVDESG